MVIYGVLCEQAHSLFLPPGHHHNSALYSNPEITESSIHGSTCGLQFNCLQPRDCQFVQHSNPLICWIKLNAISAKAGGSGWCDQERLSTPITFPCCGNLWIAMVSQIPECSLSPNTKRPVKHSRNRHLWLGSSYAQQATGNYNLVLSCYLLRLCLCNRLNAQLYKCKEQVWAVKINATDCAITCTGVRGFESQFSILAQYQ